MEGENNGSKPYEQMDDLGGFPPIFGSTPNMFLNGQLLEFSCGKTATEFQPPRLKVQLLVSYSYKKTPYQLLQSDLLIPQMEVT